MFSVINSLHTASGSPTSLLQDQFRTEVMGIYENTSEITKFGIAHQERCAPGKNTVVYTLRGRVATARATKAKGDLPVQGSASSYDITARIEAAEYMDQNYDRDEAGDARFTMYAADAGNEVIRANEDQAKRFMAMLYITSLLPALSGFSQAPGYEKLTAAALTTINDSGAYSLDNTGAERLYLYMTNLKREMRNRNNKKGQFWTWVFRHSAFDCLKFGNRMTSKDFNSGADLQFGLRHAIENDPILLVNDDFWPTTNYTDPSFSKYNVDGRIAAAGANGTPAAFLINHGGGVSPLAETLPPAHGGIEVEMLGEPYRRIETVRVTSRNSYDSLHRDAVGVLPVQSS